MQYSISRKNRLPLPSSYALYSPISLPFPTDANWNVTNRTCPTLLSPTQDMENVLPSWRIMKDVRTRMYVFYTKWAHVLTSFYLFFFILIPFTIAHYKCMYIWTLHPEWTMWSCSRRKESIEPSIVWMMIYSSQFPVIITKCSMQCQYFYTFMK